MFDRDYLKELKVILREKYDVAIAQAVTSISFTSNLLARLSNSVIRIGVRNLNGEFNDSSFLFDKLVNLDWRENENTHITDRNLALLEPFGITTQNKKIIIHSDDTDKRIAEEFIKTLKGSENGPVIGLHVGAGKIQNRWSYLNFAELIDKLIKEKNAGIYLTAGGSSDLDLNNSIKEKISGKIKIFDKKGMGLLKELITLTNLFITNDSAPMHTAAATDTPTISLFGQTNPYVWAPQGKNKNFIWIKDNINAISIKEVYKHSNDLLSSIQE